MKIVTVPNLVLRKKAKKIERVDKKLLKFLTDLQKILANKQDPPGVGLAAPQVGKSWQIFATQLVDDPIKRSYQPLEIFINPKITAHSQEKALGKNKDDVDLEGCLSIPYLYGPVPRWSWLDLKYETVENGQLVAHQRHFENFNARIIQHERDHLDGVLFTDYILQYKLPLYRGSGRDKLTEVADLEFLKAF